MRTRRSTRKGKCVSPGRSASKPSRKKRAREEPPADAGESLLDFGGLPSTISGIFSSFTSWLTTDDSASLASQPTIGFWGSGAGAAAHAVVSTKKRKKKRRKPSPGDGVRVYTIDSLSSGEYELDLPDFDESENAAPTHANDAVATAAAAVSAVDVAAEAIASPIAPTSMMMDLDDFLAAPTAGGPETKSKLLPASIAAAAAAVVAAPADNAMENDTFLLTQDEPAPSAAANASFEAPSFGSQNEEELLQDDAAMPPPMPPMPPMPAVETLVEMPAMPPMHLWG